ncbi:hypothetical protein [Pacificispira sp.]|uniref:hypothetical protein n=1 Tax=Pacificispira sp. TaxID=2888761 RepID=UPI003BAC9A94
MAERVDRRGAANGCDCWPDEAEQVQSAVALWAFDRAGNGIDNSILGMGGWARAFSGMDAPVAPLPARCDS